jgi:hypothetical protein
MSTVVPSRPKVEKLVKELIAALAGVNSSTLNETTEIETVLPNRTVADRHLAATLRIAVANWGSRGTPLTTAEVRRARTIRDLVDKIIEKWR